MSRDHTASRTPNAPLPEGDAQDTPRRLQRIVEVLTEIVSLTAPLEDLLALVVRRVMEVTEASGAVVELVDGDEMEYVATCGSVSTFNGLRLRQENSLSGLCVAQRALQYADDTTNDPRVDRVACERINARSMLIVPLMSQGRALGVLKTVSGEVAGFDTVDAQALRLSAGIIASSIARQIALDENQRMFARHAAALQRLEAIVAATATPLVVHDLDGVIELWNPAAERLLGWTAAETVGRRPPYLKTGEIAQFDAMTEEIIRTRKSAFHVLHRSRRDGGRIDVRVCAAPLLDAQGQIIAVVRTIEDITAECTATANAQALADRVRRIIERSHDAFVSMDQAGLVTEWNDSATALFGWTRDEAIGQPLEDLLVPEGDRELHRRALDQYLGTRVSEIVGRRVEVMAKRRDGSLVPVELAVNSSEYDGRTVFDAFLSDITEQRAALDDLRRQALHDPLTGLPNRAYFDAHMARAFDRQPGPNHLAVIFVDLDDFKGINDVCGHAAGDLVIRSAAERMRACVRQSDLVVRLAGDEFVVVLEDLRDGHRDVDAVARKLLDAFRQPVDLGGVACAARASLGMAVLDASDRSPADLIARADKAMYRAKSAGGNQAAV